MKHKLLKQLSLSGLGTLLAMLSQNLDAADVSVTEDITTDTTWTADNTYILTDIIYVKNNATLTIDPGTVIEGEPKSAGAFDPGALVITRGSDIMAEGTADNPIIFTSTSDDGSLTEADSGLWGGVIILGSASINTDSGTEFIEGLPTSADGEYGGNDDADSSGVFIYVSIRHGGAAIASDNEINGLTMGGVGSGTTIEYVEVFANADDGFEFFGGTVNTKYLIGAFNQDDTFDWDEGFRGKGQFWFAIQDAVSANRGAEMDGGPSSNVQATPYAEPVIYNATFIGSGSDSGNVDSQALKFRENSGGIYANSIFTGFVKGVDIDQGDKNGDPVAQDSEARYTAGTLALKGNIFHDIGTYANLGDIIEISSGTFHDTVEGDLAGNGNSFEDPQLAGIGRVAGEDLDPRPATDGPAYAGLASLPDSDSFFTNTSHKGAFGTTNWTDGWSKLGEEYTGDLFQAAEGTIFVEADITADTTWLASNTYVLTDIIYVKNGATLTIEPGTTIMGEAKSAGAFDPGALVITRGSMINAAGTAAEPIVFTSTEDDGSLTEADSGLWGGVIILGSASINTDSGTEFIEGLPTSADGEYGGNDDADSSGVFKYVSIRHGGAAIASDNEINGLTMGGVGSGTTIEYVEVFANADDGFEFFGGTVNTKYLIGAFNQDDTFDWDEGFRGKGQFWFAIQDAVSANRGAEMDGGPSSNVQAQPYSEPVVYNATFIGSGSDSGNTDSQALKFRENSGGIYANSIFTGFVKGVDIDQGDKNGNPVAQDSEARYTAGTLALKGNIFHDIGTYANLGDIIEISSGTFHDTVEGDLAGNGNSFEDPQLAGIGRVAGEDLDPRPATDGPAYAGLADLPSDAFFANVDHKGAFGATNWTDGWSKLGEEYTGDIFEPAVVLPVITLNGNANMTVVVGETFVDPGATAGVLTSSIVVTGTVDANVEGTYTLTYDVSDDNGNDAESVIRTVVVTFGGTVQVTDNITTDTTWNRANTYVLTDIIYVKDGATLTIEPGTVIQGEPKSSGAFDPGALVITRGSKIHAAGTFSKPIVFTSTSDDGNLTSADSGLWGGVIILGSASINTDSGTEFIEGLPTSADGEYGGNDDADNSGVFKYVSIRHGGAAIASDNEINGLTMGGVGSGTTIEYVEVFANADDGFEFFGGTVNTKHLIGAFNQDDTFDWDEGFRGKGQFWFAIQDPVSANRGAEMDGGPSSNVQATPYSNPVIYNATFIGSGSASGNTDSQVLKFRENSGGIYANSIFTAFVKGVDVDPGDKNGLDVPEDSEARFNAGTLALKGNIFHDIGAYASLADLVEIGDSQGKSGDFKSNFVAALSTNGNSFVNPLIGGISYDTDEGLDPRPAEGGPAYSSLSALPDSDSFFEEVTHKGAFGYNNWAEGWSFLSQSGAFGDIITAIHPELADATSIGSDWYEDPSKGYMYWTAGTEWLYQWDLGYLYQEPGTNWFYSSDTGLEWIYIDDAEVTTETVGSAKVMNGYIYVDSLGGYIYLSPVDNGDGTTTTLFYNTVTAQWGFLN